MHVNAYARTVNGKRVEVSAHDRADRPHLAAAAGSAGTGASGSGSGGGAAVVPSTTPSATVQKNGSAATVPAAQGAASTPDAARELRDSHPGSRLHSDLAAPPPFVAEFLRRKNPEAIWERTVTTLEAADLGPNRVFAYATTLAAEGGMAKDPTSSASSGIMRQTLREAQAAAPEGSALKTVKTPRDLTLEQRLDIYGFYVDRGLAAVGGSEALERIPDKMVAAAVVDTLIRHGADGGTRILQQAINRVGWTIGLQSFKATGHFGEQTFSSLVNLSGSKERNQLLNEIIALRKGRVDEIEYKRMEYFKYHD